MGILGKTETGEDGKIRHPWSLQGQAASPFSHVQIKGATSSTLLSQGYRQDSGVERQGGRQRDATELCWSPRPAGLTRASESPSGMLDDGREVEVMGEREEEEGKEGERKKRQWLQGGVGRGMGPEQGPGQGLSAGGIPGSHEDAFALDAVCPLLFAGALSIDVEAHVPACLQREQLLEELLDIVVHLG